MATYCSLFLSYRSEKIYRMKKVLSLIFTAILFASFAKAQNAEVTISLNEQFFDVFLESMFTNLKQPDFKLSNEEGGECVEKVKLEREMNGVKTAVKFKNGKIVAPIAFTGSYNAPLIGCLDFKGWAETDVQLQFDQEKQTLFGRAKVQNVQLNNVPSFAGSVVARLLQGSIDSKINPVEILRADKLSFLVPVSVANGNLKLNAKTLRHEIVGNALNVTVGYEVVKAN
jgi:hypothetical protein